MTIDLYQSQGDIHRNKTTLGLAENTQKTIYYSFSIISIITAFDLLMPGFHPSVAVLPLPFRRSVVPLP